MCEAENAEEEEEKEEEAVEEEVDGRILRRPDPEEGPLDESWALVVVVGNKPWAGIGRTKRCSCISAATTRRLAIMVAAAIAAASNSSRASLDK